ncbi:kanamycin kinase [Micromonospora echinospora]|uniref:Kanamycin kinase n=1 Tax=Micromonospora echinospora TaxID=1877 RepID=A0A1C4WLH3_MICEC|nr:APH(3') family aminoglycoside O-phosphotransferase [Micromonospora echinospora]SCE97136.1 kanamycin kinase [Micromonospora echinospora]
MVAAPIPVAGWGDKDDPWECLGERSSGATVYRVGEGPSFYVKTTPPRHPDDHRFNPTKEAERLRWLAAQGLPVPEVVALDANDELAWVVTRALPGRPAARHWKPEERWRVIDVVADVARTLHALPVAECPFERRLADLIHQASSSMALGALDLDDVDPSHEGWTGQQLWDELSKMTPPEEDDLVVCHGDFCLDNVLVDPETLTLAGILDVDRAGVSDRWMDLALALYNIGQDDVWGYGPPHAEHFLRRYGISVDQHKLTYIQLLDEFL